MPFQFESDRRWALDSSSMVMALPLPLKYRSPARATLALLGLGLGCCLLGAACGPQLQRPTVSQEEVSEERERQRELALSLYVKRAKRLYRVSSRLRTKGAELCGDGLKPHFGLMWMYEGMLGKDMKEAARSVLGADRRLRVLYVVPRAPAAQAGLRRGDALVAIDGEDAGEGEPALKVFSAHSGSRLSLTVERDGEAMDLVLDGADACPYPVSLFTGDAINAFADGRSVGLTTGMLRFTESDAELALVVGHELAHNVLDHVSKQQTNVLAGTFLGALVDVAAAAAGVDTGGAGMDLGGRVGGGAFSREFESEADYLGAYLAVRAGYDISGAPQLWRRMAVEHPASISPRGYLATHPTTPERATGLERVVEEIAAKNRIGSPLVPERIEAARP